MSAPAGNPRGVANRGTNDRGTPTQGNAGTLVDTETIDGVTYARYRAEQGTWVSASLKQQGYDKRYDKSSAYGAYAGVVKTPEGKPLATPDRIRPGQEYLIPISRNDRSDRFPPPPPPTRIRDDDKALTRSPQKTLGPGLRSGTWSARLLEVPPPEIVAADPKTAGPLADPLIPRDRREKLFGLMNPVAGAWLDLTLQEIVGTFAINLGLELNDRSGLVAVGIILPGEPDEIIGTVRSNGSQLNAFRHTFGQAMATRKFGRKIAELAGFAHEDAPTIDTTRRYFSNPTTPSNALFEADTVADQLNNEIGRRIAESLGPTATNRDLAEATLRTFRDEGLYVARFRGRGEIALDRRKLTPAQYWKYSTTLKLLNEEGHPLKTTP